MKNLLLQISILLFVLSSCDPALNSKKIIVNQSDYNVWFSIKDTGNYFMISDSFLVSKHSDFLIYELNGLGRITPETRNCEFYPDSVISGIENSDSLKLMIDITNSDNWTYTEIEQFSNGGGEYQCRFVIKNKDVE